MKKRYSLKNKRKFIAFIVVVSVLLSTLIYTTSVYGYKQPSWQTIRVKSGDTLWSIANTYNENGGDIRKFIYELKKANQLESSIIFAGDELKVPVY